MKYCVDYTEETFKKCNVDFQLLEKVDEINIYYNEKDLTLYEFLLKFKEKRINIILDIEKSINISIIDKIIEIQQENKHIYLVLNSYNEKVYNYLSNKNIPFYYQNVIKDWETFDFYNSLEITDLYISGDLCFELEKIKSLLKNNKVLRIFPNILQKNNENGEDIKGFFIRPEDTDLYEKYITTFELKSPFDLFEKNYYNLNTIFDIYKNSKRWFGNLKEIIIGYNEDLDSRYILPTFTEKRMNCGRKCYKGSKCNICQEIENLSLTLEKAGIYIKGKEEDK